MVIIMLGNIYLEVVEMARGSFKGLYTFQDVANIYNIDASTIRKQVQNCKFCDDEIRKFGKTWIITEQAMVSHFGNELFIAYKNHLQEQKVLEIKKLKEKARLEKEAKKQAKLEAKNITLNDDDDDLPLDTWEFKDYNDKQTLKTFRF